MVTRQATPAWITGILQWPGLLPLARVALVSAYLLGGLTKLSAYSDAVAEQAHFGLQPAPVWAVLAITVEVGGSLLVIFNRLVWLGAGGLGVLTLVAATVADPFWRLQGHARFMAASSFLERLGLIAGFVFVAWISINRRQAGS